MVSIRDLQEAERKTHFAIFHVVVGIRTYAAFYTAWFGSTAQVTFGGDDVFQTNLMMVIQAWHTQNKQNNDAKDHILFYLLFTIFYKAFWHLG